MSESFAVWRKFWLVENGKGKSSVVTLPEQANTYSNRYIANVDNEKKRR